MSETAVAEVVEAPSVAAEPAQEAELPNPEPEAPVEGAEPPEGSAPEPEGSPYKDIEDELDAEVEKRLVERQAKIEAEAEAKAEARLSQRQREMDEGESSRKTVYDEAISAMQRSAKTLQRIASQGDLLDEDTLNTHMDPILRGQYALVAKANEPAIAAWIDKTLPELTAAEKQELDTPRYQFRRDGKVEGVLEIVTKLAVERVKAENADLKKQLRERGDLKAAAEKLARAREAAGPLEGSGTPRGKASGRQYTWNEIQKMDAGQINALPSGVWQRAFDEANKGT